jgi:hypothetical protein
MGLLKYREVNKSVMLSIPGVWPGGHTTPTVTPPRTVIFELAEIRAREVWHRQCRGTTCGRARPLVLPGAPAASPPGRCAARQPGPATGASQHVYRFSRGGCIVQPTGLRRTTRRLWACQRSGRVGRSTP